MTESHGVDRNSNMARGLFRWVGLPGLLILLGAGVFGVYQLTIDPELEARNRRLEDELLRIEARNSHLADLGGSLRTENRRLRDDEAAVVARARRALGMVRPGEVVYRFAQPRNVNSISAKDATR